jgi:hypothetical protein
MATTGSALLVLVLALLTPTRAMAQTTHTMLGLVQGTNELIQFNTPTPGTIDRTIAVTGLLPDETLSAIDFRPLTGQLYGLATNAAGSVLRLYTINTVTGLATGLARTVAVPLPGTQWGMSFNPTVDRIRVVNASGENLRLNPITGVLAGNDTDLQGAPAPVVDAIAYDHQFVPSTLTTAYAINRATNSLARLGGPNGSPSPNAGSIIDIGQLGVAINGSSTALEITSNGSLFAAMRPNGGAEGLYRINSVTGAALLIGTIGTGTQQLDGLAVIDPSLELSPDTGTYTTKQRFDLVITANLLGRGVVSGSVTFDGADVTGLVVSCVIPGAASTGAITFRCPNLGGPVVGPGVHELAVTLALTDGSSIRRVVTWTVVAVAEP